MLPYHTTDIYSTFVLYIIPLDKKSNPPRIRYLVTFARENKRCKYKVEREAQS